MCFFGIGILIFIVGAFLSLATGKFPKTIAPLAVSSAVGGSVFCAIDAIGAISSGRSVEVIIPWRLPFGNVVFGLDPLSAYFAIPITVVVALAAVYGTEYLKPPRGGMSAGVHWFFFNFLAAAMLLVVSAHNGFLFLICWEAMSLASFFLVIGDYESDSARHAGWIYLIATHLGTACLLALFLLLGREAGNLDFASFSSGSSASALFLLAVVGFGTKAGFMPLHVWLPEAHPAAPSHVSAVMSGVMIKTGIYGLLRTLTFLGDLPPWWGWTVLGIGAASGVLGVLFALAQHDLKRLLAYSSVENIGIIAIGIGMGMLGVSYGIPVMAALGFLGALLHVLNHSLFKSLLFLGAGAVQHGTGTRDMNHLGGLLKRMPIVGAAFLVGACAISGLPPLNGFVGELMIYLGAIGGIADTNRNDGASWVVLGVLVVGGLALIGGLATACFTKAFGGVFLGEPRTEEASGAHEAGRLMRFSMITLAAACIAIALSAPIWPKLLQPCIAAIALKSFEDLPGTIAERAVFPLSAVCGVIWIFIVLAVSLAVMRIKLLSGREVSKSTTWDCGYIASSPRIQYTASSFAQPIVLLFRMFLRSKHRLDEPKGFFPERSSFRSETPDVLGDYFYRPAMASIAWAASKLRWLQHGRIQLYVLYIALTIFVLLIWKLG